MANAVAVTLLEDGIRNCVVLLTGTLDTSNEAYTVKVNPATLVPVFDNAIKADDLRIKLVDADISDGLQVNLYWDIDTTAGNAVLIEPLYGRKKLVYQPPVPPLSRKASGTALGTGGIGLSTIGFSTAPLSYSIKLELIKRLSKL